jgi:hypothetical protein
VNPDAIGATGRAKREAALAMMEQHGPGYGQHVTLATDKGHDTKCFVAECRLMRVNPSIANKFKCCAIDGQATRFGELRRRIAPTAANRGSLRLGEGHRRGRQEQGARPRARTSLNEVRHEGIQSVADAEAA